MRNSNFYMKTTNENITLARILRNAKHCNFYDVKRTFNGAKAWDRDSIQLQQNMDKNQKTEKEEALNEEEGEKRTGNENIIGETNRWNNEKNRFLHLILFIHIYLVSKQLKTMNGTTSKTISPALHTHRNRAAAMRHSHQHKTHCTITMSISHFIRSWNCVSRIYAGKLWSQNNKNNIDKSIRFKSNKNK